MPRKFKKRLLDFIGWKKWPAGGSSYPVNMNVAFENAFKEGIKELELTEKELASFISCYKDELLISLLSKNGFNFRGIKITKVDGEEYPDFS